MVSTTSLSNDTLLQALLRDSLNGLILYQIIRDQHGRPTDFRYLLVNPAAATLLGESPDTLLGKSCQKVFPQGDELRACYQQVALTGQKLRVDYQLPTDGRWFEVLITEQEQQTLLCFFTDITDRVLAEQELIKQLTLLQQTEELANLGSWDYDREANRFFWSDGMYRLFGIEPGTSISLQTLADSAISADRAVASRLVEQLKQGTSSVEEVFRIQLDDQVRTLKIKGGVKFTSPLNPAWVLGICWDIRQALS